MARTYRLRHLPALPGTARKFVNGIGVSRGDKTEANIWKEVARTLGTPYRDMANNWKSRWRSGTTKAEWDLYYEIEKETIFPVGSLWKSKILGYGGGVEKRAKTWYKINANRTLRRRARSVVNHIRPDFDGMVLPHRLEVFDTWAFS